MFKNLFSRKKDTKVFVIGLDCAPPELIFDAWRDELPNLKRLMDSGAYGVMYSSGVGLPKNELLSYYWITLSASGGHEKASELALKMAKQLSNEQISQAEADAKKFVPRTYASLNDPATVIFVQYALHNIGYDAGPIDGMPGKMTREGIRAYEEASNLPVNGQISISLLDGLIQSTTK